VDNVKQDERLLFINNPRSLSLMQEGQGLSGHLIKMLQPKTYDMRRGADCTMGCPAPGWWFENFDPIWGPFVQRLRRKKPITLPEFRLMTSHVPGLTAVEKTIAVSAFIAYKNTQS
jgi:hypothetical protein